MSLVVVAIPKSCRIDSLHYFNDTLRGELIVRGELTEFAGG